MGLVQSEAGGQGAVVGGVGLAFLKDQGDRGVLGRKVLEFDLAEALGSLGGCGILQC